MSKFYITIPNGNKVSIATYVKAWKVLKQMDPEVYVEGWQWFGTKAMFILQDMRAGMHDRINIRGLKEQNV